MGTRADFYIRRKKILEQGDWVGSIAWDGYPEGIPDEIKKAKTAEEFYKAVKDLAKEDDSFVDPVKDGWPWPWKNSYLTDYVYTFSMRTGKVTWKSFDKVTKFPNMEGFKKAKGKDGFLYFTVKR